MQPREKTAEFVSFDFGTSGVMSDDTQRAERIEMEWS
jgi:hypothetical protein